MILVHKYNSLLKTSPLSTRIITAFGIALSGDALSQYIESQLQKVDFFNHFNVKRSLNLALYGSLVFTPFLHHWYIFLAKKFPGNNIKTVAKKLVADRVFLAPFFVLGFFISQTLMNGGTWKDVENRIEKNFFPVLKMNVVVWVPGMLLGC